MKNEVYNVSLSDANLSKLELCTEIKSNFQFLFSESNVNKDPDQRNYIVSSQKVKKLVLL